MAEQQLVRRKCDYCGDTQEFPAQQANFAPAEAARVAGWIVMVRMFLVKGQIYPVHMHACKDSCASNIISLGMLDLPQQIKDSLAEEERLAQEFQKKLKEKRQEGAAGEAIAGVAESLANEHGIDTLLPTPAGEA